MLDFWCRHWRSSASSSLMWTLTPIHHRWCGHWCSSIVVDVGTDAHPSSLMWALTPIHHRWCGHWRQKTIDIHMNTFKNLLQCALLLLNCDGSVHMWRLFKMCCTSDVWRPAFFTEQMLIDCRFNWLIASNSMKYACMGILWSSTVK